MTTYWDDFAAYTVGTQPTGWSEVWHGTPDWTVEADANAQFGGKALVKTGSFAGLAWGTPGADPLRADCEVTARWKLDGLATLNLGLMVRGSNPSNSRNGYFAGYDQHGRPRIYKYLNSFLTEIGVNNHASHWIAAGQWYRVRFRVTGTTLQAKWWADGAAEPAAWTIETTDSTHTAAGFVGFAASAEGRYDWVGVGTGGDTAPTAPPHTISDAGGIAPRAALGTPNVNLTLGPAGAIAPVAAVTSPSVTVSDPVIQPVGSPSSAAPSTATLEWAWVNKVIWVAELYPVNLVTGEEQVIHLSTDDYRDSETGQYYDPAIMAPPMWGRSMASGNNISGESRSELGALQVLPDARRRTWTDPTRWSWGERRVVLAAGDPSWPRSAFKEFYNGRLQGAPLGGFTSLDFNYSDFATLADRPAVTDRYLGLGYSLGKLGASSTTGATAGAVLGIGGLGVTVAGFIRPEAFDSPNPEEHRIVFRDDGTAGYRLYAEVPSHFGAGTWRLVGYVRGLNPVVTASPFRTIDPARTYEVVMSYLATDNTVRYMIDGEIVAKVVCTGTPAGPVTANLQVGGGSSRGHRLNHVRIYERGYNDEELLNRFRRVVPQSDPEAGAWWPLNDGAGGTALDRGPNGHHLTLSTSHTVWRHSDEGPASLADVPRRPVVGRAESILPPLVNPHTREYSAAGHADNRRVLAVYSDGVELARSETDYLDVVFQMDGGGWTYLNLNPGSAPLYTVEAGDHVAYEVYWPPIAAPNAKSGALEILFSDGVGMRQLGVTDQRGLSAHPNTDLSAWASQRWYERRIPIGAKAGHAITKFGPAIDYGAAVPGPIPLWIRNIRIVDAYGTTKHTLWRAGSALAGHEVWLRNPATNTYTLTEPAGDWIATRGERGFRLFEPAGGSTITSDVEGLVSGGTLAGDVSQLPALVLNSMGGEPEGGAITIPAGTAEALRDALAVTEVLPNVGTSSVVIGSDTDKITALEDAASPPVPGAGLQTLFVQLKGGASAETATVSLQQGGATVFSAAPVAVAAGAVVEVNEAWDAAALADPSGRGLEVHVLTQGGTLVWQVVVTVRRYGALVGDWPQGDETKRDLLNRYIGSADGWWGINDLRELVCGRIEHPDDGFVVTQDPVAIEAIFTVARGGGPTRVVASIDVDELPYVIQDGDRLVYEIIWDDAEGGAAPHIVVTGRVNNFSETATPLDAWGLTDEHGYDISADVDLTDVAGGQWLRRSIDLSPLDGASLVGVDLACHADLPGTGFGKAVARIRRIVVVSSNGTTAVPVFEPTWFKFSGFLIPPPTATVIEGGAGEGLSLEPITGKIPPDPDIVIPEAAIVAIRPVPVPPPIWEQGVIYRYSHHTSSDLAEAATAEHQEFVARPSRTTARRRQAIRDKYPDAVSAPELDTRLAVRQDAEALAEWRLDTHGAPARVYEVEVTPEDANDYFSIIGSIDIAQRAKVLHREIFTRLVGRGEVGEYFRILAVRGSDNGLLTLTVWRTG